MGDLDKVYDRINEVQKEVSKQSGSIQYIVGKLDAILPDKGKSICTKEDLNSSLAAHVANCKNRPSRNPSPINLKAYKIGGGIIGALIAGAIAVGELAF